MIYDIQRTDAELDKTSESEFALCSSQIHNKENDEIKYFENALVQARSHLSVMGSSRNREADLFESLAARYSTNPASKIQCLHRGLKYITVT